MIPGMAGYQRNHANDSDNDTTDSYDDVHIATPSQYWRCCFVSILSVELIFSVYFALIIFWICALVEPFVLAEFSYFVVGFTFPVLPVSILLVLVVNDTERSPSRVAFVSVLTLAGQIAGLVVLLIFIWRPSVDFKQLCDGYTMVKKNCGELMSIVGMRCYLLFGVAL